MSKITWVPVISLWQPWASAVVTPHPQYPERGIKEFETRHWRPEQKTVLELPLRVVIHASKKWDRENMHWEVDKPMGNVESILKACKNKLPFQCLIGTVEIIESITTEDFFINGPKLSKTAFEEFQWGNWEPNRFGWKLANPVLWANPIHMEGKQTPFWKLPLSSLPEQYQNDFLKTSI